MTRKALTFMVAYLGSENQVLFKSCSSGWWAKWRKFFYHWNIYTVQVSQNLDLHQRQLGVEGGGGHTFLGSNIHKI